jgi:hypothetical protein
MDWLTFLSTSFKALGWPVTAGIALFVLKPQIATVFLTLGTRLSTMKIAGIELAFTDALGSSTKNCHRP